MSIEAVLCDVDGVLRFWDGDPVAAAERDNDLPEGALARVMFARAVLTPACTGEITAAEWAARGRDLLVESGLSRDAASALVHAHLNRTFTIDPRFLAWLAAARARMPVWLLTNQMDDFNESMSGTGVFEQVDGVINSAEVGVAKPEPEIYRVAAAKVGVAVDRCLFIDDRAENTEAAAELGMATVLYRTLDDVNGVLD